MELILKFSQEHAVRIQEKIDNLQEITTSGFQVCAERHIVLQLHHLLYTFQQVNARIEMKGED
jgi:hypothetical protein